MLFFILFHALSSSLVYCTKQHNLTFLLFFIFQITCETCERWKWVFLTKSCFLVHFNFWNVASCMPTTIAFSRNISITCCYSDNLKRFATTFPRFALTTFTKLVSYRVVLSWLTWKCGRSCPSRPKTAIQHVFFVGKNWFSLNESTRQKNKKRARNDLFIFENDIVKKIKL